MECVSSDLLKATRMRQKMRVVRQKMQILQQNLQSICVNSEFSHVLGKFRKSAIANYLVIIRQ